MTDLPPPPPPASGYVTPPPPPGAKRPWWKKKRWIITGAVLVLLIIAAAIGGGSKDDDLKAASATSTTTALTTATSTPVTSPPAAATSATAAASTSTTQAATTTEATTTTAAKKQGTRDNPYSWHDPLKTEKGMGITITGVNLDADDVVAGANRFNDAPPAGMQYVVVDVHFKNEEEESEQPGFLFRLKALGSQNVVHDDCTVVLPKDMFDVPELYPGGEADGQACALVPTAEVEDNSLLLIVNYSFGDEVFINPRA
jgi:hypothetical protein